MAAIIHPSVDGLICAFRIIPDRPPQAVGVEDIKAEPHCEQGLLWLHVNSSLETGRKLVRQLPELPTNISEELLDSSEQLGIIGDRPRNNCNRIRGGGSTKEQT